MSARTCLLCGKTLSRIWVGAGDDFCSREHGNQYRLKRGMDRLTEANKISSLMRRRETPRPITTASLPLDSASSRRDFPGVKISASGETRLASVRPLSVAATPRIAPVLERYVTPPLPRAAGSSEPRQPDSSPFRFSARNLAPVAPMRIAEMPARIPRARAALLPKRALGTGGEHRGFGALRHTGRREHAGLGGMAPSRIEPPGAACFPNARRPRGIKTPQKTGGARGLSRGYGFRRPARRGAVSPASPAHRAISLRISASGLRPLSNVRGSDVRSEPRTLESGWRRLRLVCPSFAARVNPTGIKWPGAARIGRRSPFNGHAPAVRERGPIWNVAGPAGFSGPRRSLTALERGMPTPCVVPVPLAPVRANGSAHHVALAPFTPQNSPFGYKEYEK